MGKLGKFDVSLSHADHPPSNGYVQLYHFVTVHKDYSNLSRTNEFYETTSFVKGKGLVLWIWVSMMQMKLMAGMN